MKRYLMRGAQSPFDSFDAYNTYFYDKIWSNVGNLLFTNSIYRNLYCEDVEIDMYSKPNVSDVDYINEHYDSVLLPLANAFRPDFMSKLNEWTKLIKALKIPCVVIGVGLQADLSNSVESFPFDDDVKHFMNAVLSKSASVGVRGEITKKYLQRLGFSDVEVIGCPSMYMWGDKLPDISPNNERTSFKVSINGKISDTMEVKKYLFEHNYEHIFIPQTTKELKTMLTGAGNSKSDDLYPASLVHKEFLENRVKFCVNTVAWFELLKKYDLSIGTRIHGNIAAVLAGTPAYVIATDTRVTELADYHEIAHCNVKQMDMSQDFFSLYMKTDFKCIYRNHKERYERFRSFMKSNSLDIVENDNVQYDEKIRSIHFQPPVDSILFQSSENIADNLTKYNGHVARLIDKIKKENTELKAKEKKYIDKIEQLERCREDYSIVRSRIRNLVNQIDEIL